MKLFDRISDFLNSPVPSKEEFVKKIPVFMTRKQFDNEIKDTKEATKYTEEFKQYMMAFEFANVLSNLSHMAFVLSRARNFHNDGLTNTDKLKDLPYCYAFDYIKSYEHINRDMKMIEECNIHAAEDIRKRLDAICSYILGRDIKLEEQYIELQNLMNELSMKGEHHEEENK